jgi:glucose/arabinose dehydrogenase
MNKVAVAAGAVAGVAAISLIIIIFFVLPAVGPAEPESLPSPVSVSSPGEGVEFADASLVAEPVAEGFAYPTSMAFVGEDELLVLEKETGIVYLLSGGTKTQLLKADVSRGAEQGLLGVAVTDAPGDSKYVFVYLTESDSSGNALGNRIYRYSWDVTSLASRSLILELPAVPGPIHNGGKLAASEKGELFAVVGDVNRQVTGPLTNEPSGEIDDTAVIVRMNLDGEPLADNPFTSYGRKSLSYYYAYGVRNSFGMDVDPVTGVLWATENGPDRYDELNVVEPGMNSGWKKLTGPMARSEVEESDLTYLEGAKYKDPVFSWKSSIGITDIEFIDTDKLGEKYRNNIFVGDYNAGNLYYFALNANRDGVDMEHADLADHVADSYSESLLIRLGAFPGGITDIETGPDGYVYVLTFMGDIYRIVPATAAAS